MHVPLGSVALLVGVLGLVVYFFRLARGDDTNAYFLTASVAAFVAGWVACVSIPRLEKRMADAHRDNSSREAAKALSEGKPAPGDAADPRRP